MSRGLSVLLVCCVVLPARADFGWQASTGMPVRRLLELGDKIAALTDEKILCFDVATGRRVAAHPIPWNYASNIVYAADGVTVAVVDAAAVVAFDPCAHRVRWARLLSGRAAVAVYGDSVYVASEGPTPCVGLLARVSLATGEARWERATTDCGLDAEAFLGSQDTQGMYLAERRFSQTTATQGQLHAFELTTGRPVWDVPYTPDRPDQPEADRGNKVIRSGQTRFVLNGDGLLTAFAADTTTVLWRFGAFRNRDFVVGKAGRVLVLADEDGGLRAMAIDLPKVRSNVEGRVHVHGELPDHPLVIRVGASDLVVGAGGRFRGVIDGGGRMPIVPAHLDGYDVSLCLHRDYEQDRYCNTKPSLAVENHAHQRLELDLTLRRISDRD